MPYLKQLHATGPQHNRTRKTIHVNLVFLNDFRFSRVSGPGCGGGGAGEWAQHWRSGGPLCIVFV